MHNLSDAEVGQIIVFESRDLFGNVITGYGRIDELLKKSTHTCPNHLQNKCPEIFGIKYSLYNKEIGGFTPNLFTAYATSNHLKFYISDYDEVQMRLILA